MNAIDKRIAELQLYRAESTAPDDLDEYWERTLLMARGRPLSSKVEQSESLSPYMKISKVVYEGYDETPIHGTFIVPAFVQEERLPCTVIFHGYTGSKNIPEQYADWLLMGFAVFAVDVRGQGGETGNLLPQHYGMSKGWITQGLLDPEQSYYRAIAVDACKALEWAAKQPEVDPARVIAAGVSQGGGLALIASALSDIPAATIADIPNMCHMDYGISHSTGSLSEAADFVSRHPEHLGAVLSTLSYFDMVHLCDRLTKPVFFSVGFKDPVCPPETVFAVYNRVNAPKQIQMYPFNGHQVSGGHFRKIIRFLIDWKICSGN
ncbi:acetylxylan esterase [Paenibacillus chartarius]|uniref:Acetylxylan esterase n=1 Tax=Paenibacillus chartarius TaxID=747481 RepID=A0ABV6DIN4_9BACL